MSKFEKTEAYSEGLLKSMLDGLAVLDLEGKIIDVNDAFLRILRIKKEDIEGVPFVRWLASMVGPTEIERLSAMFGQLVTGVLVGIIEVVITAEDGTEVALSVAPSVVRDARGKPIMIFVVIRDISERKQMEQEILEKNEQLDAQNEELRVTEEELRASNEELKAANEELREAQEQLIRSEKLAAIGQLAGGVGHELRNPLGAIKNATYYVKGKVAQSELAQKEPRVMEFLDIVDDEVNSSNKIINDLLGFSRVGRPSVSPTRMKKVIEDALSRIPIPENIELLRRLDADLTEIKVDSDQIQQVLVNIMTNAVQAMPEGGKLTISTKENGEFLEVEIADTGSGMPQEVKDKVFEPLFTTRAKGIGLGLAVCKSIVDRHEGHIEVSSKLGKGTTFNIKLPLKAA
jgi:PAS domain S-box-containing protein